MGDTSRCVAPDIWVRLLDPPMLHLNNHDLLAFAAVRRQREEKRNGLPAAQACCFEYSRVTAVKAWVAA
jgi:hypothetical protein